MSIEDGKQHVIQPRIANPAPLGLSAFALTTFVLSVNNSGSPNLTLPNVITGLALFYGGICQLLAGMWEFRTGNTFGATAFSSYAGFWLSFGVILIPGFDITAPYSGQDLDHALGIYLAGWTIFTFILFLATFRSNAGMVALFFFLLITFLLLTIGKFTPAATPVNGATKAGGIFGIITAFIAWYNALAGLLTKESSYFTVPVFDLSNKRE
ncbi:6780_t:CDS:2 [Acaulospora colombiana]|uniref:6780_t:CDS:1 n=1 Tax=Acaulospora colombiana TaxID=27376 RepID=A0ACA9KYI1_9GLOM|nr:6780_t:CDS:2 [Acaulospora colombiana]